MESKLKQIRAGNKAAITKYLAKFDELKQHSEEVDPADFVAIEKTIVEKQKKLTEVNEKLIDVLVDDDIAAEIDETDGYMFNLEAKLREIRKYTTQPRSNFTQNQDTQAHAPFNVDANAFIPTQSTSNMNGSALNPFQHPSSHETHYDSPSCPRSVSVPNPATQSTSSQDNIKPVLPTHSTTFNHRLPKLDLPHFDGDVLNWSTFWDSFESSIHYNTTLTPIQKFSYLKAQLVGIAAQTVTGFALTHANYETAIALLKERFGHPQKIINSYMKALSELPSPVNELNSLRNYRDTLDSYVRGLENLGQTQEMYGALLVPTVISKLPVEVRKNIARENDCDNITLNILRKAITKEVKVLETGQFTDRDGLRTTATFLTGARNTSKSHNYHREKKEPRSRPCIYCGDAHFAAECKKITDVSKRLDILKEKKRCFNCLGDHRVPDCKSKNRCRKCQKKHHTSICGGKSTSEQKTQ